MRVLKGLVIVMAVLIFVGMGVVVWSIFNLQTPDGNQAIDTRSGPELASELSLELPAGCTIASMQLDGRRLAIHTAAVAGRLESGCGKIYIVDVSRGQIITTVLP